MLMPRIVSNRGEVRWPLGPYVSEMVDDFGDHVVIKSVRANAAAGVAVVARAGDLRFRGS
jgi:hypothetical protein